MKELEEHFQNVSNKTTEVREECQALLQEQVSERQADELAAELWRVQKLLLDSAARLRANLAYFDEADRIAKTLKVGLRMAGWFFLRIQHLLMNYCLMLCTMTQRAARIRLFSRRAGLQEAAWPPSRRSSRLRRCSERRACPMPAVPLNAEHASCCVRAGVAERA